MRRNVVAAAAAPSPRVTCDEGHTLPELVVVLSILTIVLASLTTLFLAATRAQADMSNTFRSQQNARIALDKLRREIHCARAVTAYSPTAVTISLGAYCPTNTTGAVASVTWCTKDKLGAAAPGAGAPYTLWRYQATACSGTGRNWVSHLKSGNAFPALSVPASGSRLLSTLGVSLVVDVTPADARNRYVLTDDVVLRNSPRA